MLSWVLGTSAHRWTPQNLAWPAPGMQTVHCNVSNILPRCQRRHTRMSAKSHSDVCAPASRSQERGASGGCLLSAHCIC